MQHAGGRECQQVRSRQREHHRISAAAGALSPSRWLPRPSRDANSTTHNKAYARSLGCCGWTDHTHRSHTQQQTCVWFTEHTEYILRGQLQKNGAEFEHVLILIAHRRRLNRLESENTTDDLQQQHKQKKRAGNIFAHLSRSCLHAPIQAAESWGSLLWALCSSLWALRYEGYDTLVNIVGFPSALFCGVITAWSPVPATLAGQATRIAALRGLRRNTEAENPEVLRG